MSMKLYYMYVIFLIATFDETHSTRPKCPKPELISPCRCMIKREEYQVWCSHTDLPKVISSLRSLSKHLTSPIDELILENNYLPSLPSRTFANLKVLRLMLRQNSLERVSHDWLYGLEDFLMELFIVEPKIRYLPEDSLNKLNILEAITFQTKELKRLPQINSLPNLRYLQIESDVLTEISTMNLMNLPVLEKIHINKSKNLRRLQAGVLENLPHLKSINISHCGIEDIHPKAFLNLPELKELHLVHNSIKDAGMVGKSCQKIRSLKHLNLNYNKIKELPEESFVDLPTLQYLHLSFNNISELHQGAFLRVPSLKHLYLNNNELKKIHPESFMQFSGSSLEEVWVINNQISQISQLNSLLTSLPRLLYVDMSFNKLEVIPFGSLRGHPTLEVIKLDSNKIKQIDEESFMAMPALRELSLRNNSLSNRYGEPLWNLPSLKGLDLSLNNFRKLESSFLSNLPSLRRLDFSDNELEIVDSMAFSVTPLIEYVNLSNNYLQFLHQETFKHLEKLYEVDISRNRLEKFQVDFSEGLEYLHLNSNKLRVVPSFFAKTNYSLRYLDISYNLIEELSAFKIKKLQSLRKLFLTNNFVRHLDEGVLKGLPGLEILDMRSNKIFNVHQDAFKNLQNLRELILRRNSIESLNTMTFQKLPNLSKLDISENKLVDFLHGNFKVNPNIKYLNISHNFLVEIPKNIFKMKQLMFLDVSYNRIKYLPVEAFSKLGELIDLRISNNFLRELRLSTFSRLRNLRVVYLNFNDIDNIETNTFHSLPSLEMIKLDNNKLSKIPSYTFNNLTMLHVVELQRNSLEMIASDAFNQVPSLIFLNLSGNYFESVRDSGLRNVPSLEVLDLCDNNIGGINSDDFIGLNWMVEVRLDKNNICEISGKPFNDMPRLRVISLRKNRLKRVRENVLEKIRTNIAVFDVDENPLLCDCNVFWLKVWSEESSLIGPHCSNGNLVRELKLSPNVCKDKPIKASVDDCRDATNQFSKVFSKFSHLRNVSSEEKANNLPPLPQESEYFYDEYVDYPFNDSLSLVPNTEEGILDRFLKVNHSSLMKPQSSHVIPGDTPTLYAASSKNITKPDVPKEVPDSPSSSGFTFFGVPLPSISLDQILGRNKNIAPKSDPNTRTSDHMAERKVAIMNIPVMRGTTAKKIYRLPSTPIMETGGFRPILPGEGGFKPIIGSTTNVADVGKNNMTPESFRFNQNSTLDIGKEQGLSRDFKNSASTEIRKITQNVSNTELIPSKSLLQDSTTYSSIGVETTSIYNSPLSNKTVQNTEPTLVSHSLTPNKLLTSDKFRNVNVIDSNNSSRISEPVLDNATIFPNPEEDDVTMQSWTAIETESLVTEDSEINEESLTTEIPYSVDETTAPSPMPLLVTSTSKNISMTKPQSSHSTNDVSESKVKGLTLDQIANIRNATGNFEHKVPMSTLLIPGGQQPHTRSSGRSTITKVLSPFTTGASPSTKTQDVNNTGETVTLDPQITNLDEMKENWYFVNYNKTYSEPYHGVMPSGNRVMGIPGYPFLFFLTSIIHVGLF